MSKQGFFSSVNSAKGKGANIVSRGGDAPSSLYVRTVCSLSVSQFVPIVQLRSVREFVARARPDSAGKA